jgi:RhoGAP domain
VAAFNTPPTYGNNIDLALASLDDVGALLLTYLDCLPGGIVPVWVRSVLGDAIRIYEGNGDSGSASVRERKRAIRAAQLVLRLLPPAHFNLLVYLLGFLSRIPLYEAWNGWNVRGVARTFARVVVGVGAGARASGTRRDDWPKNGKGDWKNRGEDVDWVAGEEEAVEVLEWLLKNWDDLSCCLFLSPQPEGQGEHEDDKDGKQGGTKGGRGMHRAAAARQLDPPHNVCSEDVTSTVNSDPAASHPSVNNLLARIADLERENTKWKWLQGLHESELRLMKERAAWTNTQTSIEDAVREERRLWVEEVQALGNAWTGVRKTMDEVGGVVGAIVERFAAETSKRSD